mmetsp:Transcript_35700/g.40550  ORF Transcript_35700/g.40550 Transcript_35700/m.40550 type:complete len:80 (-) Transcript_35700:44-283(-)
MESVLTSRGGTQITQKYSWRQQYVYRTSTISTVNDGVFDRIDSYDDDVKKFPHKILCRPGRLFPGQKATRGLDPQPSLN